MFYMPATALVLVIVGTLEKETPYTSAVASTDPGYPVYPLPRAEMFSHPLVSFNTFVYLILTTLPHNFPVIKLPSPLKSWNKTAFSLKPPKFTHKIIHQPLSPPLLFLSSSLPSSLPPSSSSFSLFSPYTYTYAYTHTHIHMVKA